VNEEVLTHWGAAVTKELNKIFETQMEKTKLLIEHQE
jgi:hypothetical protein